MDEGSWSDCLLLPRRLRGLGVGSSEGSRCLLRADRLGVAGVGLGEISERDRDERCDAAEAYEGASDILVPSDIRDPEGWYSKRQLSTCTSVYQHTFILRQSTRALLSSALPLFLLRHLSPTVWTDHDVEILAQSLLVSLLLDRLARLTGCEWYRNESAYVAGGGADNLGGYRSLRGRGLPCLVKWRAAGGLQAK